MAGTEATAALHTQHYGRLFGLAYRMLGSVAEAEDVVQDTFVRWSEADRGDVGQPGAWLTTTATRLCLDRLKSAQRQREIYVGPWLPEPLVTDGVDPADLAGTADSLTFAFLVVLEALSPLERAVFVLHDVFGYPHDDIAAMLGRTPAAVRQVASRARRHLEQREQRFDTDRAQQRAVAEAFLAACAGQDLDAMLELLAPDVTFTGDGGGVVSATRHPVHGAERVARLLGGLWQIAEARDYTVEFLEVNAEPGLAAYLDGTLETVMVFEVQGSRIAAVRGVRNPAKLEAFRRARPGPPAG